VLLKTQRSPHRTAEPGRKREKVKKCKSEKMEGGKVEDGKAKGEKDL